VKFGRRYRLTIQTDAEGGAVVVEYPLTLEFNTIRSVFAAANTGRFTLYNLKPETRNKVFHDRNDPFTYRSIILQAGYVDQNPLPVIFRGNINVAYSTKRRADWVTEIEAFDGAFAMADSNSNVTIPAGTSITDMIGTLFKTLKNVSTGAIGNFTLENSRGTTLSGNSWDLVAGIVDRSGGGYAFIDKEKAHVLKQGEYISDPSSPVRVLNSETGLLKAQRQFKDRVDIEILFDSTISVGQLVELRSLEPRNDGQYVVLGVSHSGTISGSHDSNTRTALNLDKGKGGLTGVLSK
jgi:hypothetical protein